MPDELNILNILNKFREKNILIVGDIMLDTYFKGEVTRINVEAPVPIVKVEQEFHSLGGAGNVASNVVSLGGKATLFSFIGRDHQAEILRKLLDENKIENFLQEDEKTIQKIRIIGNNQQLARMDFEKIYDKIFRDEIKFKLKKIAKEADLIIISDYNKGAITPDLINFLSDYKRKIIVDPKPKNKSLYKNVLLIKTNEKEIFEMTYLYNLDSAGKKLKEELQTNVLVTRGKDGMALFSEKIINIPTYAKEVFDVTGAGDTTIAALALSIASGASLNEAAIIANHAAGIKVKKAGTYAVNLSELISKFIREESKVLNLEELQGAILDLKKKGKEIVWTNGCFDLLHIGHTRYLKEAKKLGDVLIVGINSDDSVRRLKGPTRPIQTEKERAEILSSLEFIDYVIIFPETTVEKYLYALKPEIYVKGGDYTSSHLEGHIEGKAVKEYGGEIKVIPLVEGKSTTHLVEKAKLREKLEKLL